MRFWNKCPLLFILLVSSLIFETISVANQNGVYRDYPVKTVMTPFLASYFTAAKDGVFPGQGILAEEALADAEEVKEDSVQEENRQQTEKENCPTDESGTENESLPEDSAEPENNAESEHAAEKEHDAEPEECAESGSAAESEDNADIGNAAEPEESVQTEESVPLMEENTTPAQEEKKEGVIIGGTPEGGPYSFTQVEESYFDDALFIGDSRTQGMLEYGGLEERAAFYCKTSLTVYDLFEKNKAFIKEDGENITLTEALSRHQYKKIYLMIGINEMGTGTAESFFHSYADAVYNIQKLQPEAIIFVQGIMRVGSKKNAGDRIFNNTNVNIRNVEIQTLADNKSIFYVDVNDVVCDENGNLHDDWTFDGIHLKAKYYQVWKDYLLLHGIVK